MANENLINFFKSSPIFRKVALSRFKEDDSENLREFLLENESDLLMEAIEALEMPSKEVKNKIEEEHYIRVSATEKNNRFYCNIEGTEGPSLFSFVLLTAHFEYIKNLYDVTEEELVEIATNKESFIERGEL